MTANSTISLYTKDYYDANFNDIGLSSDCGNVAELVEIDNYIYVSIKSTEYPYDVDGQPISFRNVVVDEDGNIVEATVQTDLDELRAGIFNCYRMPVSAFLIVKDMQRTAGEWYDPYVFERWYDTTLNKERWRLILTREGTEALSIKVLNDDGSYWYTPGAFIDQGDNTWLINSWDGAGSTAGQQVNYVFIYGSTEISQTISIPGDINTFDSHIAYGDTGGSTGGGVWVDSGETVTQLYGANTIGVTDSEPFPSGTPVRINDIETSVSYIHSPGILVLATHIPVTGGEVIKILSDYESKVTP